MKRNLNRIVFLLSCLFLCYAGICQSLVHITSPDSTRFKLIVNGEKLSDSLITEGFLNCLPNSKANVRCLDSLNNLLAEDDIFTPANKRRDYEVRKLNMSKKLLLIAESDLDTTFNRSLKTPLETDSNELKKETSAVIFQINSLYYSTSAPNLATIEKLEEITFERERYKAIEELIKNSSLNSKEVLLVLQKITYEDKRAELIQEYPEKFKNYLSSAQISKLFKLDKYKNQAKKALGL